MMDRIPELRLAADSWSAQVVLRRIRDSAWNSIILGCLGLLLGLLALRFHLADWTYCVPGPILAACGVWLLLRPGRSALLANIVANLGMCAAYNEFWLMQMVKFPAQQMEPLSWFGFLMLGGYHFSLAISSARWFWRNPRSLSPSPASAQPDSAAARLRAVVEPTGLSTSIMYFKQRFWLGSRKWKLCLGDECAALLLYDGEQVTLARPDEVRLELKARIGGSDAYTARMKFAGRQMYGELSAIAVRCFEQWCGASLGRDRVPVLRFTQIFMWTVIALAVAGIIYINAISFMQYW